MGRAAGERRGARRGSTHTALCFDARRGMPTQVPAQLPQCAFPKYYLRYLDAVQFFSLNMAANAEPRVL